MRLARLDVSVAQLHDVPVLVSDHERPVALRVRDADSVIALASVAGRWSGSWGVWLRADQGYGAGLIARDVKTLSTLLELDHVVIDADANAAAYAEVVRALLSDEEVTIHNAVARITRARNRPAPPRPVSVWSRQGDSLRDGGRRELVRETRRGDVTIFTGLPRDR